MPETQAPPPPDRTPDAVIYPVGVFRAGIPIGQHLAAANRLFGPVLGADSIGVRALDGYNFAYARTVDGARVRDRPRTLLFETTHPLAKQPRFKWYRAEFDRKAKAFRLTGERARDHADHKGGFLFGFAVPDTAGSRTFPLEDIAAEIDRTAFDAGVTPADDDTPEDENA